MARMTMIQAINQALAQAMEADDRVLVMGEDVGRNGGVFRATDKLYDRFGPERAIDTPLAEGGIVGTAIGMAVYGLRPVAEIQFMGFTYQAFSQLVAQAARIRYRSLGQYTCPLVVRAPYGGGVRALELHSDTLEARVLHTPGLKFVTPATPRDAKGLLLAAIDDPDPVIVAEPLRLYRSHREEVPEERYTVPIGKARLAREGSDVTLVAWGSQVPTALEAAEAAEADGVSVEVIDLRTIVPMDQEAILASVRKTHRVVIVQEAPVIGGVGAEIAALVSERAILSLEAPPLRVGGYDMPYPPSAIEEQYLPSPERVRQAIDRVLAF
ncbi:MAG: alpha-ketoacid dehydrogenase subunit beta [Firmicutes bacterium]|nr:alpha-ketoacid dehydrogenase subunit beta [Bacillota bacterium]